MNAFHPVRHLHLRRLFRTAQLHGKNCPTTPPVCRVIETEWREDAGGASNGGSISGGVGDEGGRSFRESGGPTAAAAAEVRGFHFFQRSRSGPCPLLCHRIHGLPSALVRRAPPYCSYGTWERHIFLPSYMSRLSSERSPTPGTVFHVVGGSDVCRLG